MIEKINPMFSISKDKPAITTEEIATLEEQFSRLPQDYLEILKEASYLQVSLVSSSEYLAPETSENLYIIGLYCARETLIDARSHLAVKDIGDTDAVAVGTDGGDSLFIYMHGNRGWGLYLLNLTNGETAWVAPTLGDLLIEGTGIEACLKHSYGML